MKKLVLNSIPIDVLPIEWIDGKTITIKSTQYGNVKKLQTMETEEQAVEALAAILSGNLEKKKITVKDIEALPLPVVQALMEAVASFIQGVENTKN